MFVKVHTPWDTLCKYAEQMNIRMPFRLAATLKLCFILSLDASLNFLNFYNFFASYFEGKNVTTPTGRANRWAGKLILKFRSLLLPMHPTYVMKFMRGAAARPQRSCGLGLVFKIKVISHLNGESSSNYHFSEQSSEFPSILHRLSPEKRVYPNAANHCNSL